jgi:hypothetical protein
MSSTNPRNADFKRSFCDAVIEIMSGGRTVEGRCKMPDALERFGPVVGVFERVWTALVRVDPAKALSASRSAGACGRWALEMAYAVRGDRRCSQPFNAVHRKGAPACGGGMLAGTKNPRRQVGSEVLRALVDACCRATEVSPGDAFDTWCSFKMLGIDDLKLALVYSYNLDLRDHINSRWIGGPPLPRPPPAAAGLRRAKTIIDPTIDLLTVEAVVGQAYECPVCLETSDRLLRNCGHPLCTACIGRWIEVSDKTSSAASISRCSLCRGRTC